MTTSLLGLRTVIYPAPDLDTSKAWCPDPSDGALTYWGVADVGAAVAASLAHGATEHVPPSAVGDDIVTATVRTPQGTIVGFIYNPHFAAA
jgi:hypothetical protein